MSKASRSAESPQRTPLRSERADFPHPAPATRTSQFSRPISTDSPTLVTPVGDTLTLCQFSAQGFCCLLCLQTARLPQCVIFEVIMFTIQFRLVQFHCLRLVTFVTSGEPRLATGCDRLRLPGRTFTRKISQVYPGALEN